MKTKLISLLIIAGIFSLTLASLALAEFATTRVYFNVPATTTFFIAMPDNYSSGSNYSISGSTQASATATDFITFNFSSASQSSLQEPSVAGNFSRNQSGITRPIFYIGNTGNVNISLSMYLNETTPAGITMYWNGSTTPASGCGTTSSTLTALSGTAQLIIGIGGAGTNKLPPTSTCRLNITLYANTTTPAGGQSTANLITNSST